jgi:protein gp37
MDRSKIRWTGATWNFMTGCTQLSPGCDHCYALTIAEKFRGTAFPHGFDPTFKPEKLGLPRRWSPRRVFVNSMSDIFHEAFTDAQIDEGFAVMAEVDVHEYQVLTKRPTRMRDYVRGWLARTGRTEVPAHIWLGATIEHDRFTWRANRLREIPAAVRFISAEPLLSALPSLNLAGIGWLIVGGESGSHLRGPSDPRWMDMAWARELRDKAEASATALFFKQASGSRTEMNPWIVEADGSHTVLEQYPFNRPTPGVEEASATPPALLA